MVATQFLMILRMKLRGCYSILDRCQDITKLLHDDSRSFARVFTGLSSCIGSCYIIFVDCQDNG